MLNSNRYEIEVYGEKQNVLKFGEILRGEHATIVSFTRVFAEEFEFEQDIGEGLFLGIFEGEIIGDIMEPLHDGEINLILHSIMKNPLKIENESITLESFNKLIEDIGLSIFNQKKIDENYLFQKKLETNEYSESDNLFSIASGKSSIIADIVKLTKILNLRVEIKSCDYYGLEEREVLFENGVILKHTLKNLSIEPIEDEDDDESCPVPIWSLT